MRGSVVAIRHRSGVKPTVSLFYNCAINSTEKTKCEEKMNRIIAIDDARIRYSQIKDKCKIKFNGDEFGFDYPDGLNNMTFNEYGKMCELGYIISRFYLTEEEVCSNG